MGSHRTAVIVMSIVGTGCAGLLGIEEGEYGGTSTPEAPPPPSADVLARLHGGLVAYWHLDGNGKNSADAGFDLRPAKSTLPPTYEDGGRIGASWRPGLASSDQCENCNPLGLDPAMPLLGLERDFTISIWVKPAVNPTAEHWLDYGIFDNDQVRIVGEAFNISPAPCHPAVFIMRNGAVVDVVRDIFFDFRTSSNVDRWNHLVAYRRGLTLGLRINLYETTTTAGSPAGQGAPGPLRLGEMASGYDWQGSIDEVGVWARALDKDEMDVLYNYGRGVPAFP